MQSDTEYLKLTLEEARRALQEGNQPVGAILVDASGQVVARSHNTTYSKRGYIFHAEMSLLMENQIYLWENQFPMTLYSSLEPCVMCLGAAIISRITRIVWAADDYWAGGTRSYDFSSKYLQQRSCELISSPSKSLQKMSIDLVSDWIERQRPEILLNVLGKQIDIRAVTPADNS